MKKIARFLDNIFGFSLMKKGANLIKLTLSKEGRMQLAHEYAQQDIANQPDLLAIRKWFPWTCGGIIFLIVGYIPLYFFLLRNIAVWPFNFMAGFAVVAMICMLGVIALVAIPVFRYRNFYSNHK